MLMRFQSDRGAIYTQGKGRLRNQKLVANYFGKKKIFNYINPRCQNKLLDFCLKNAYQRPRTFATKK